MTYNGWSNYETWNVKLWLDNEEGSYREVQRMARNARNIDELAQALKELVNDAAPDLGASCYADLLNAALGEVDWHEMATSYFDEEHEASEEND